MQGLTPPSSLSNGRTAALVAVFFLVSLTGCDSEASDGDSTDAGDDSGDAVDVAEVEAVLADLDATLVKASSAPFPSDGHALADTVEVWTSPDFAVEYATIDMGASGSQPSVPPGAMLVKEQFDSSGVLDSYTVMVKLSEGSDPGALDWWWGFANSSAEVTLEGSISTCVECHAARPDDGWLFGVP